MVNILGYITTTMKLLLDNLFFLGQVTSLLGLAGGAGLVLQEAGLLPRGKSSGLAIQLATSLLHPFRRFARI